MDHIFGHRNVRFLLKQIEPARAAFAERLVSETKLGQPTLRTLTQKRSVFIVIDMLETMKGRDLEFLKESIREILKTTANDGRPGLGILAKKV